MKLPEAINIVSDLIQYAAGAELPCEFQEAQGEACIRRLNPPYSRPLLQRKEFDRMCSACRCYWHLQMARNDLIAISRMRGA